MSEKRETGPSFAEVKAIYLGEACPKCGSPWPPSREAVAGCDICQAEELYGRIRYLRRQLAQRDEQLEALKAIVEKLPKTADGVVVVPGMEIFSYGAPDRPGGIDVIVARYGALSVFGSPLYSTREAAEQALAKPEQEQGEKGEDRG